MVLETPFMDRKHIKTVPDVVGDVGAALGVTREVGRRCVVLGLGGRVGEVFGVWC